LQTEFNFVDGHWGRIQISFGMFVSVTKLHFIAMTVSTDIIVTSKFSLVLRDVQSASLELSRLNLGCNGQIIGPYFFERTSNGPVYLDFLQNYLPIYLEDTECLPEALVSG